MPTIEEYQRYQDAINAEDQQGLESPNLDLVDIVSGGLAGLSKSVISALADVGFDMFFSLTMDAAENQEYLKAAYVGKRGMRALGIDASKDLAGQFSGLIDREVRLEVADPKLRDQLTTRQLNWPMNFEKTTYDNQEILRAYPNLGGYNIVPIKGRNIGSLNAKTNEMKVGSQDFSVHPQNKVVAHEGEHFIQFEEGRYRGGSPDENWADLKEQLWEKASDYYNDAEDILDEINFSFGSLEEAKKANHYLVREYEFTKAEADRLSNASMNIRLPSDNWAEQYTELSTKAKEALAVGDKKLAEQLNNEAFLATPEGSAYDNYMRLAGEAEARDTAARSRLTKEEKARTMPLNYDVPDDKLIKLYSNEYVGDK